MKINCEKCKKRLKDPGALVFSPPMNLFKGSELKVCWSACVTVRKTHICKECYLKMLKWIYGKAAIVVGVILVCASVCSAEDWSSDYYLATASDHFADLKIVNTYVIYAEDRGALLKAMPIPDGQTVTIYIGDRPLIYKEWPKGTIYGGKGRWFLKYENNHGYMDLWRLE